MKIKLTPTERLVIANQNKILSFLDKENSDVYLNRAEIAEEGFEGLYPKLFTGIDEGVSNEICNETHDILTMYRVINNTMPVLTEEEQKKLEADKIKFQGFDANHDPHYFFMRFIIEKEELYEELGGHVINSHSQYPLTKYRKMFATYNAYLEKNNHNLDKNGLIEIIKSV